MFTPFAFIIDPSFYNPIVPQTYILVGGSFSAYAVPFYNYIVRTNNSGSTDTAFNMGTGFSAGAYDAQYQSDGKVVVGGIFTTYQGSSVNRIIRLNSNGTKDATLSSGTDFTIFSLAIQSNGKILVGGINAFTRLNSDGTPDTTLISGSGFNGTINSIYPQSDGKILVGGAFTTYSGSTSNRVIRLNPSGSIDTTFNIGTGLSSTATSIDVQSDGKVILGGQFSTFNTSNPANGIVRLTNSGSFDSSFVIGSAFNSTVNALKIQSDGKVIVGGSFTTYSGSSSTRIIRINVSGTLDTTFNVGTGLNVFGTVSQRSIQFDSENNIYLTNNFTTYSGSTASGIVKILPSGSIDTTFTTGFGLQGYLLGSTNAIGYGTLISGSTVLMFGAFSTYNFPGTQNFTFLTSTGSQYPTFNLGSGFDSTVNSIAIQSDNKIIVGGQFTAYSGSTSPIRIARINTNGTLDTTFSTALGFNSQVDTIAIQPDGKILAGGQFNTYNNVTFNRIIRLTSTGTQDNTFLSSSGFNNTVNNIQLQSDGKMIIGGQFTTYSGSAFNRIMRLGTSGSIDTTFVSSSGANGTVHNIRLQSDEKMVLGGAFTTYSGSSVNRIVRLGTSGSIDTTFNIGTGLNSTANALAIQSDGKFIAGGSFTTYSGSNINRIVRINTDGTRDTTFNVGTGFDNIVNSLTVLPDGKIAAGGFFTSYSGSTLVNKIAILNISGTLDTTFVQSTSSFNGTSVGFNSTVNLVLPITI
jgi:uncharacterized delta-60 repeat protein